MQSFTRPVRLRILTEHIECKEFEKCISVDDLKNQTLILHDGMDAHLIRCLDAAFAYVETSTNRKLRLHYIQNEVQLKGVDTYLSLKYGNPTIQAVSYIDTGERLTENVDYYIDKNRIIFKANNERNVQVEYTSGYATKGQFEVPADLKYAILLIAATLVQVRSDLTSESLKRAAFSSTQLMSAYVLLS